MHGEKRSCAGRKPVQIDLGELEKLSSLGCTYEELAVWFRCSVNTIKNYAEETDVCPGDGARSRQEAD